MIIGGSMFGGSGIGSGIIHTENSEEVSGLNLDIGSVTINGFLFGGAGAFSGVITSSGKIGTVNIGFGLPSNSEEGGSFGGSLIGGGGDTSGAIIASSDIKSVKVAGNVTGSFGDNSGSIASFGDVSSINIGGALVGGSGNYGSFSPQGQIHVLGTLRSIQIGTGGIYVQGFGNLGLVEAAPSGLGNYSGEIRAGSIGTVKILGSISGGNGVESAAIVSETGNIGTVSIGGSVSTGFGARSGAIMSTGTIGAIDIGGSVGGSDFNPLVISARGNELPSSNSEALAIRSVRVHGSVSFVNILAGYDINGSPANADVQIGRIEGGNVDNSEGATWEGVNIAAGAQPGFDNDFGTFDDDVISSSNSSTVLSKIASIVIHGTIGVPDNERFYGFVAEQVNSIVVNGTPEPQLTAGPHNDFFFLTADPNHTTRVNEILKTPSGPA